MRLIFAGAASLVLLLPPAFAAEPVAVAEPAAVEVFKTPTCGCCTKWVTHLESHGYAVTTRVLDDLTPVKKKHGIEPRYASCHTAVVNGYVVEGHVPADVIGRFLAEAPDVTGITVPGMPAGSPGMETGFVQPYQVLTFDDEGNTTVYAEIPGSAE